MELPIYGNPRNSKPYRNLSGTGVRVRKIKSLTLADLDRIDDTSGYFSSIHNRINAFGKNMAIGWVPEWELGGRGSNAVGVDVRYLIAHPDAVVKVPVTQSSRSYAVMKAGNILVELVEPRQ